MSGAGSQLMALPIIERLEIIGLQLIHTLEILL